MRDDKTITWMYQHLLFDALKKEEIERLRTISEDKEYFKKLLEKTIDP